MTSSSRIGSAARPGRPSIVALALASLLAATVSLALISTTDGQLESAIATQRARVAMDASSTNLNDLANLQVVMGDVAAAEENYRRALELEPESVEVRYNLALLLQHLGKLDEALRLFRQVVKDVPDAAWAHLQIGAISSEKGKRKQAVEAFAKAFALEPRLASASINPHLQGRPEVLEAMLKTTSASTPQTAPLSFSEPDRIARLLVGESAAARAAASSIERKGLIEQVEQGSQAEAGKTGAAATHRRLDVESLPTHAPREGQTAQAPLPQVDDPESDGTASSPPSPTRDYGDDPSFEDEETVGEEAAEQRDQPVQGQPQPITRRVVGADDLEPVRGAGVESPATTNRRPSPARSTTSTPARSTLRPSQTRAGGRTSRFRPGARSSVRLHLETVPTRIFPAGATAPTGPLEKPSMTAEPSKLAQTTDGSANSARPAASVNRLSIWDPAESKRR